MKKKPTKRKKSPKESLRNVLDTLALEIVEMIRDLHHKRDNEISLEEQIFLAEAAEIKLYELIDALENVGMC